MSTLGGNVCIRNGKSLDYCWREAVISLLPVCDFVVVCDGESTDGTQEEIREWMKTEPRIQLCIYPWPDPKGDNDFWVKWLNYCREHIRADFQLQLDADEVLFESSYPEINAIKQSDKTCALWCRRYNFWRDAQHLIPPGVCCSNQVVRFAPQSIWLPSDGPHPRGAEAVRMAIPSNVEIGHYGFLRERSAFFLKAKALQSYFFNSYDARLSAAEERTKIMSGETSAGNWMDHCDLDWADKLVPYTGEHPKVIRGWLEKRGFKLV